MNDWMPKSLVKSFSKGNGVLFLGRGISEGAGAPSTQQLTEILLEELDDISPDESFPEIAQSYNDVYSRNELIQRIREQERNVVLSPTSVHQALISLPVKVVLTINNDHLLEDAYYQAKQPLSIVCNKIDIPYLDEENAQLIKLYGDLKQPNTLVVTVSDYDDYLFTKSDMTQILTGLLQNKVILYIGINQLDSHIRQHLKKVQNKHSKQSFTILFNATSSQIRKWKRLKINVINLSINEPNGVINWQGRNQLLTEWLHNFDAEIKKNSIQISQTKRTIPKPKYPYKFLDYFEESDEAIFKGRKEDSSTLFNLIQGDDLLTVLYGHSGTGKTSLIHAGLRPLLKEEGIKIVYTRLLGQPLTDLWKAISGQSTPPTRLLDEMGRYVTKTEPMLIILDQFEEFFIRQGKQCRLDFFQQLVENLSSSTLDIRCLISIRSDYLHQLDELKRIMNHDPLQTRFGIYNLGGSSAREAITAPAKLFEFSLEQDLLDTLLNDLQQQGVSPAHLQIICYKLWEKWQENGQCSQGLTQKMYEELGGHEQLLATYLEDVLNNLADEKTRRAYQIELPFEQAQDVVRRLLKRMISAEKTKVPLSIHPSEENNLTELSIVLDLPIEKIHPFLQYLLKQRIIRYLPDDTRYELAHDTMVNKIWEWVTDDEKEILRIQDMLVSSMGDYQAYGNWLTIEKLQDVENLADKLTLNQSTLELLLLSAIHNQIDSQLWIEQIDPVQVVRFLTKQLENLPERLHHYVATALGYTYHIKSIPLLQTLLNYSNNRTQKAAVQALVSINEPHVTLPVIENALWEEIKLTRVISLIEALEQINTETSIGILLSVSKAHPNIHVQDRIIKASVRYKQVDLPTQLVQLIEQDHYAHWETVQEIAQKIIDHDIGAMFQLINHSNAIVQEQTFKLIHSFVTQNELIAKITPILLDSDTPLLRQAIQALLHLTSTNASARIQALNLLSEQSNPDVYIEQILPLLTDPNTTVQIQVINLLSNVSNPSAYIEQILPLLTDPNSSVQSQAMKLLSKVSEPDAYVKQILPFVADSNSSVQIYAIQLLSQVTNPDAYVEQILPFVTDPNVAVQRQAIKLLSEISNPDQYLKQILPLVENRDPSVRTLAIQFLSKASNPNQYIEQILPLVAYKNPYIRNPAIKLLSKIMRPDKYIEQILPFTKDPNPSVQSQAIKLLTKLSNPDAYIDHILPLITNINDSVRSRAIQFLSKASDPDVYIEKILPLVGDKNPSVRNQALEFLSKTSHSDTYTEQKLSFISDDNPFIRSQAIKLLSKLPNSDPYITHILPLLTDKNPSVRSQSIQFLSNISDPDQYIGEILPFIGDTHPSVRGHAIQFLSKLHDPTQYIAVVKPLLDDYNKRVRKNAYEFLQRYNITDANG